MEVDRPMTCLYRSSTVREGFVVAAAEDVLRGRRFCGRGSFAVLNDADVNKQISEIFGTVHIRGGGGFAGGQLCVYRATRQGRIRSR